MSEDNLLNYQQLGEKLLIHTLSCAFYALTKVYKYPSCNSAQEGRFSLYMVENSGLNTIIRYWDLNLDPEKLKQLFYEKVENEKNPNL